MPIDEEKLYRLDRMLRASGMAPLSREELQSLAQQMQQQGVTPQQFIAGAEGGFVTPSRRNIVGRQLGGN